MGGYQYIYILIVDELFFSTNNSTNFNKSGVYNHLIKLKHWIFHICTRILLVCGWIPEFLQATWTIKHEKRSRNCVSKDTIHWSKAIITVVIEENHFHYRMLILFDWFKFWGIGTLMPYVYCIDKFPERNPVIIQIHSINSWWVTSRTCFMNILWITRTVCLICHV